MLARLVFALLALVAAHNELLKPHGVACYHEELRPNDRFSLTFQVGTRDPSSSEQQVLDFWVTGPSGQRLTTLERVTDGSPEVQINQRGRYEYCFSNEFSGVASKDVTFHVSHLWGSVLKDEKYDTFDGQVKILDRLTQDVNNQQKYMYVRERVHRNTAESTNDRVKWWSILQLLVVVANALFQVAYLKRFFEVKSRV